jgi:hypothetical protein
LGTRDGLHTDWAGAEGEDVHLLAYDDRLNDAARAEGLLPRASR